MEVIARVYTPFKEKFGIPRQSGIAEGVMGKIIFEPKFRTPDAVRGIEGFSHLWLIWCFSESEGHKWSPTVRPPRLGGNRKMGVFATRSPFRPNSLGLSSVRLQRVELDELLGPILHISGVDMLDGTPIYDIKPYLPYTDSHPDAAFGFAEGARELDCEVEIPKRELERIAPEHRDTVLALLRHGPHPSYKNDSDRTYGMSYGDYEIKFTAAEGKITVKEILSCK